MKHRSPLWSMQKMSLPSARISVSISNSRPSTHRRRLFSRFALGMTGMHDSTVILVSLPHNAQAQLQGGLERRKTSESVMPALSAAAALLGPDNLGCPL